MCTSTYTVISPDYHPKTTKNMVCGMAHSNLNDVMYLKINLYQNNS